MGRGVYHVFNRGLNDALDRNFFVDLLRRLRNGFRLNVYHYVVMSNHFHLAVEVLDSRELSSYVGGVCSMYSRHWHRKNGGGHGPIWQGRFKSVVVQTEK
jgi:REP element-mobilizing transposase RayT